MMDNFTIAVDGAGIALVTFDVPGKKVNVVSQSVQRDLDALVSLIRTDNAIRGVILRSGKASGFCAGADLKEMLGDLERWRMAETEQELCEGVADAGAYSRRVRAIETCGKPVAVIVEGLALGGGLELALGCHFRVVLDDPQLHFAFPEAGIGLMPGAGGTQRLMRLLGMAAAMPYLLDGTRITLADALAGGIFHATAPADALMNTARAWLLECGNATAPWDADGYVMASGSPDFTASSADGEAETAKANIRKCLHEGAQVPMDPGLLIESRYFFDTARSPEAQRRIEAFFTRA